MSDTVSVIIPIYNSEKFLSDSLESVLNQSYSDIEIIAINDGSTDDSLEILKHYEDKITIIDQKTWVSHKQLMQELKKCLDIG